MTASDTPLPEATVAEQPSVELTTQVLTSDVGRTSTPEPNPASQPSSEQVPGEQSPATNQSFCPV